MSAALCQAGSGLLSQAAARCPGSRIVRLLVQGKQRRSRSAESQQELYSLCERWHQWQRSVTLCDSAGWMQV